VNAHGGRAQARSLASTPGAAGRLAVLAWAPVSLASVLSVLALFVGLRYWLALSPVLSETYYDEALTGLMALEILRGVPQVFYWGEPYGGAVGDAYIAAAAFQPFGTSTLILRMSSIVVDALWAWAAYSLARGVAGPRAGLLASLLVAVPPVFLSFVQLSSQGEGVAMALGVIALAAAARLADPTTGPREAARTAVTLGLAAGFGWWASQMVVVCLLASAATVLIRPRLLRTPAPYLALGLFTLASLPFWIWNWRHEWATFRHLLDWGGPPGPLRESAPQVATVLLATLQGGFWDGRAVTLPAPGRWLGWVLVAAVYLPAVGLAVARLAIWVVRMARFRRPWQEPLDIVVLAFWGTLAAHLATWFGSSGVLRYAIMFYATLPVLVAVVLVRLARWSPTARAAAVALAVAVLGYNGLTHVVFIRESAGEPYRPVDGLIARLDELGIRHCYATSRVSQVISFESGGRIVCADFYGYRDFTRLQMVDAVDDPASVALVTSWALQSPSPEEMAATLQLMGGTSAQETVGDYVIFHHVRPPDGRLASIPVAGWSVRASTNARDAAAVLDRRVWTRWSASKDGGEWLELDLGRVHRVAQVTLETGPFPRDAPAALRVETSVDGRAWQHAGRADGLLAGVHWWKGHPRADDSARVIVGMAPRPARHVRVVQTGQGRPNELWSVSEVFVYEPTDRPWTPPAVAVAAQDAAARELAHWMDDPTGPHPQRSPITYDYRRAQVSWATVFASAERAVEAAPEWEAAHHLHAVALALSGWSEEYDVAVDRARADGDWPRVLRWADLADARFPELWRSGRSEARVEALTRLGYIEAAAAARQRLATETADHPARRVRARFADAVELTGLDLPARVEPGTTVTIRYAWRGLRRMRHDYTAFVHIMGSGGIVNHDHALGSTFGTSRWSPGERIRETLRLTLPVALPAGRYEVKVGVWHPDLGARLRVTDADQPRKDEAVTVATLLVGG
jgi:F5/8 type C domain-containing protein/dolichyl-phosphate-mannose-protein mannosyltransferase